MMGTREEWLDLLIFVTAPWRRVVAQDEQTLAIMRRINRLEIQMSDTAEAIVELNTETNKLAERIDAALDGAVEAFDDATAAELRGVSARLKGLAADANNPVPDPVPAPGEPLPPVE